MNKMTENNEEDSSLSLVISGITNREACQKRWIAVIVKVCTEKKVSEKLDKLNIENYVPTQREIHQWSDRKKTIDRVVIPMVVFVNVDEQTERQLKTYSYIYKILSYPGSKTSAIIPNEQIERLKFMLNNAPSTVELNNMNFEVGETIRIKRGPLKGLEGELYNVSSEKQMVAVRIECLGYACVNVAKTDIEKVID